MSSLEGQAADRKAKLAALRNKRKQPATSSTEADQSEPEKKKTTNNENFQLKSRNFNLETRSAVRGFDAPPTTLDENSETVEAVTSKIQDEVLAKFRQRADFELNDTVIQEKIKPRNIAWDMQRDIQEDLDLLQEKTDDVIKTIVKERIRKLREESTAED